MEKNPSLEKGRYFHRSSRELSRFFFDDTGYPRRDVFLKISCQVESIPLSVEVYILVSYLFAYFHTLVS